MPILDIFKKKKEEPSVVKTEKRKPSFAKATEGKEKKIKPIEKPKVIKSQKEVKPPKVREKTISGDYRVLKSPHITEKATNLAKGNQYVFKVWPKANKTETKKAIEGLYGVDVLSVKIINVRPKQRRLGKIKGWRKAYKKAIVRIKEGQKIEVIPR